MNIYFNIKIKISLPLCRSLSVSYALCDRPTEASTFYGKRHFSFCLHIFLLFVYFNFGLRLGLILYFVLMVVYSIHLKKCLKWWVLEPKNKCWSESLMVISLLKDKINFHITLGCHIFLSTVFSLRNEIAKCASVTFPTVYFTLKDSY